MQRAYVLSTAVISGVAVSGCHSRMTSAMRSRVNEGGWWMLRASRVSRLICIFTRCYGLCSQSPSCSASGPRRSHWQMTVSRRTNWFLYFSTQSYFSVRRRGEFRGGWELMLYNNTSDVVSVSRRLFCNFIWAISDKIFVHWMYIYNSFVGLHFC